VLKDQERVVVIERGHGGILVGDLSEISRWGSARSSYPSH